MKYSFPPDASYDTISRVAFSGLFHFARISRADISRRMIHFSFIRISVS